MRIHSMLKVFSRSAALVVALTAAACVAAPDEEAAADPAALVTEAADLAGDDLAGDDLAAPDLAAPDLAARGESAAPDLAARGESAAGPGDPDEGCSFGYYRCPTTGAIFEYEALACSPGPSKPQAAHLCDLACPVACKDSGWIVP